MTTTTTIKTNIMEDKTMERTMEFWARVRKEMQRAEMKIDTQFAIFEKCIAENNFTQLRNYDISIRRSNDDLDAVISYINYNAEELNIDKREINKAVKEVKELKNYVHKMKLYCKENYDDVFYNVIDMRDDKNIIGKTEETISAVINEYKVNHIFKGESKAKYSDENMADTIQAIAELILRNDVFATEQIIIDITKRILDKDAVGMLSEDLADNGQRLSEYGEVESQEEAETIADNNSQTGSIPVDDESSTYTDPVLNNSVSVVARYQEGQILRSGGVAVNPAAVPFEQGQENDNGIPLPIDIS